MTPNIHTIIRQHVSLEVRCIDRVYLHAYMPKLQTSGGLCYFLHDHLGYPVPSPALLKPRHDRFVAAVEQFAARQHLEIVPFERGESKDVRVAKDRARFTAREGVVFIGVAQEKMRSFKAHRRQGKGHTPVFDFSRQSVAVNHYYFYVHDPDWGPAFVKIGTYLPYPVKLCLNGHEWVKQHLRRDRIRFESLDNGFLSCADPTALQAACDALGPADVQSFFDRWSRRLPWPMTADERAAGYDHRLALCQLEVSLTQVFDRPVQGRHFFEAVIRENLDLGRPNRVRLLFPLRLTRATPPPPLAIGRESLRMAFSRVFMSSTSPRTSSSTSKNNTPCAPRPPSTIRWTSTSVRPSITSPTCATSANRSIGNSSKWNASVTTAF